MNSRNVLFAAAAALSLLAPAVQAGSCSTGLSSSNPESAYTVQADGTVLHGPTGLIWKRCSEGQRWTGSQCEAIASEDLSVTQVLFSWDGALDRAKTTLFAGQSDWRLPNIKELRSLAEECRGAASINEKAFPQTTADFYWSDSPFSGYAQPNTAWGVNFYDGSAYNKQRGLAEGLIRLVRGGLSFDALRFTLTVSGAGAGSGTVLANAAGMDCAVTAGAASGTCSADLDRDLSVTLSAVAAPGSVFTGWSGACGGTAVCTVPMNAVQSVTATFGVAAAPAIPVCTLSASAAVVNVGDAVTLTPSCSPAATYFVWTGGSCAGTSVAQCVTRPTDPTEYTATGGNAGGMGVPARVIVDVTTVQRPACALIASPSAITSGGVSTLTATCTPTATSYVWTGGSCAGTTAATCAVNPASTTSYTVAGVNTLGAGTSAGATVTVTAAGPDMQRPVCTLSASPASITAGGASTLTASCSPAATSFVWTGGSCAGTNAATCTVMPSASTTYTVAGVNEGGTGNAASSTVVLVTSAPAYTLNADGTATDPRTGLIWMRCAVGQSLSGTACAGTSAVQTWDQARALTNNYSFAGQTDWRLPNARELQTLVDRSRIDPAIDPSAFPNTASAYFWTSTAYATDSSSAWTVVFGAGDARKDAKSLPHPVRLVRGGASTGLLNSERPIADYVDLGDGTVTHTPSGLTWQRCALGQSWVGGNCSGAATTLSWNDAMQQTSGFAGKTDWRLPTEDELLSLPDYSLPGPAVSTVLFPNASGSTLWSSSTYANSSNASWSLNLSTGETYHGQVGDLRGVRFVRGRSTVALATFSATLETDADKVFNWAERTYPELFSPAGPPSVTTAVAGYRLRMYPATQSYLGVNTAGEHHLFYLGPRSEGSLLDLGLLSGWVSRAGQ